MALTLNDLPAQAGGSVSDDDLLLTWETGAGSGNSRKVTVGDMKADLVRENGNHTVGNLVCTDVSAATGAIDALEVATGLTMGSTVAKVLKGALAITASTLAANATEDKTATLTGAVSGDVVLFSIVGLPAGLVVTAWVSSADTITFRITNLSSGSISGAAYTAATLAIRAS